ncbi:MAG: mannitol dehydrogenase family protein [Oscillospiraceae bacterium]|nr:mannitol dehydrogenase family protein [Oscillospiraceae bacterium]
MELTFEGIRDRIAFEKAGINLPSYDCEAVARRTKEAPRWVHFGIGNIFRIFLGGIADGLLEKGLLDRGITGIETFDYEVVDRIYEPFDNLGINVILNSDGTRDIKVIGSIGEAVKSENMARVREIFRSPDLQLITFTITEKGYALTSSDGSYFPFIERDLENGPEKPVSAMSVVAAGLLARYEGGKLPVALVSMDNCAKNGKLLKSSVEKVAEEWVNRGFAPEGFLDYIRDEETVAFDSTMIDKITPRPSEDIAGDLERLGLENMMPFETAKRTYIAPFANGEKPQYLVIEDRFPNGRPALEEGFGVYMGSFETVNMAERMKVTALLNPVHSATGPIGVLLGIDLFADLLEDVPAVLKMARMVAYDEGLPMVEDPGIISPHAFVDELFDDRFPNRYLGDTNIRLCTDVSQGVGVRFGETIKAYANKYGSADMLTAVPLGIAGWLRYMMGIDDSGGKYVLAPDPMNDEISAALSTVRIGEPDTLKEQLKSILSNESVFHTDLYASGIGEKIEEYFRSMIAGCGAVMDTVTRVIGE